MIIVGFILHVSQQFSKKPLNQSMATKSNDREKSITANSQKNKNSSYNKIYSPKSNTFQKVHDEKKDHSEDVWKKLGYKIKFGERHTYKMYGRKIYKPDQVVKMNFKSAKRKDKKNYDYEADYSLRQAIGEDAYDYGYIPDSQSRGWE